MVWVAGPFQWSFQWSGKMADMTTVGTRQQGEVDEAQHPSGRGI